MTPYDIARGYIGLTEGQGPADNPKILEMYASVGHDWVEHDSVAWCAAFVGHCLERAGIRSTRKLTARSYLDWGVPIDLVNAQQGDIGVIPRGNSSWQGHVFFIDRSEGAWVWGLGGNQDDAVNVKRYPVSKLLGVRRAGNVTPRVEMSVQDVQRRLKYLGYHEVGQIDGQIGPRTHAAILAFRNDNDLPLSQIIDIALTEALLVAKPRPASPERAVGTPESSRIVSAANAQIALGAAGYAGLALNDIAPLITQAEGGQDLATRILNLVGLGSYAGMVMPALGALIFVAVIYFALKAKAARIEDHRSGRTP
jgi:uncharacterized protein (TIGR02594 family)